MRPTGDDDLDRRRAAGIDFRVLGPLQAIVDGTPAVLGGSKPKSVLAALLINCNRVVPAESLGTATWNDDPPDSYLGTLQVYISSLRRVLRVPGDQPRILQTLSPGYRLTADGAQVDVIRFRRHRDRGRMLLSQSRFIDASSCFREALDEWTGRALADLTGLRFADEFAAGVEEERMATLQWRIDADLDCGRHRLLVGELTDLTRRHPLREPLWAQLMLALYRCGQQADALEASRRLRVLLGEELGIDPSPQVQDLESRILRQESLASPVMSSRGPISVSATMVESDGRPSRAHLRGASGVITEIPASGLRLGRDVDNDLIVDDAKISRHHAVIVDTGIGHLISDLRSTNGTFVREMRVADGRVLVDGDLIRLGRSEFWFVLHG